jgi:NAD(P)-dependent dehydrogenase (short-subunit alcohol dehydrogenase family)
MHLHRRGASVAFVARTADRVHAVAAEGDGIAGIVGDVSRKDDIYPIALQVTAALGGLDVLVNNASQLGAIGPLMTFDVPRFGQLFPVNVGAPMVLTQLAVPLLSERRGLIVNITSDAATAAYPGWGPYGATKAAFELLTRTLASELHEKGVSAVLVDPGDMRTRMHQEAFPGEDISDRPLPEVTIPFWNWLFAQDPEAVRGERFAAQHEDARWLQQV